MINKKFILFIIILCITSMTGCWNYKDLNKSRLVAGLAIDYDSVNNEYIVTSEIINLSTDKQTGELFKSTGKSIFEAIRKCTNINGRKLLVAHVKIVVISKDVAKKRILTVVDYLLRDAEYPSDLYLLVSDEVTAAKIFEQSKLNHKADSEKDITSFTILDCIRSQEGVSKYSKITIWQFIKNLLEESSSSYLPIIKTINLNNVYTPELSGMAIFKEDKYIGELNQKDAMYHLLITDKLKGGIMLIDVNAKHMTSKISLEILGANSKIRPIYKNGKLTMKIDVSIKANFGEISSTTNVLTKEMRPIVKEEAIKQIKFNILSTISKVQKNYHADVFLFATKVKSYMPEAWRKVSQEWDCTFNNLPIEVNIDLKLISSALTNKTITPR
ncbi:Ger(x)C family spore germination protein [Clostridiaceae bacterium M8S5]|nr:Ger(x)C family spore germination protein [Clostridiaceae bacterium M8S5]